MKKGRPKGEPRVRMTVRVKSETKAAIRKGRTKELSSDGKVIESRFNHTSI